MNSRRLISVALVISAIVGLAACASPEESAAEFATWAAAEEFVVSVDAHPKSGTTGPYSLSAHLVVDGAIDAEQLSSLAEAALEKADSLGATHAGINIIVGNAWGFSVDGAGIRVGIINELRDDAAFVGATVAYEPLDYTPEYTGGVRGTVGSQAALRGANDALVAAALDNGADIAGLSIRASTADGAFSIAGEGEKQPLAAMGLWQAISGRVVLVAAEAVLSKGAERLAVTVGSAEDKAVVEDMGSQFPDVALTVDVG